MVIGLIVGSPLARSVWATPRSRVNHDILLVCCGTDPDSAAETPYRRLGTSGKARFAEAVGTQNWPRLRLPRCGRV